MEYAVGIIATLVGGIIWWALDHSRQCAAFHERLARLEERVGGKR